MNVSRKDLKRLLREFPLVKKRTVFSPTFSDCDEGFVDNNLEAAVWLLENSDLIIGILYRYDRVAEIVKADLGENNE